MTLFIYLFIYLLNEPVTSPVSGHVGTCPPGVWEIFSLYVETSCLVWFVLCQTL